MARRGATPSSTPGAGLGFGQPSDEESAQHHIDGDEVDDDDEVPLVGGNAYVAPGGRHRGWGLPDPHG